MPGKTHKRNFGNFEKFTQSLFSHSHLNKSIIFYLLRYHQVSKNWMTLVHPKFKKNFDPPWRVQNNLDFLCTFAARIKKVFLQIVTEPGIQMLTWTLDIQMLIPETRKVIWEGREGERERERELKVPLGQKPDALSGKRKHFRLLEGK